MTNTAVTYRYADRNLLAERYHYQYTPYEGPEFLSAYFAHRQVVIDQLESARNRLLKEPTEETKLAESIRQAISGEASNEGAIPLASRDYQVLPAQPGTCEFLTRSLLLDLWQCHVEDASRTPQLCDAWVNLLVKRYEVTKRLYLGYTAALKPAVRVYDLADNYALLAALLMRRYCTAPDLRYLNTALKLIDLLASMGSTQQSQLAQLTTLGAAEAEVTAVQALLELHGVGH